VCTVGEENFEMPKHFSTTAALVTLDLHSAKSYLLQRKLTFLRRQLTSDSFDSNRIGGVSLMWMPLHQWATPVLPSP